MCFKTAKYDKNISFRTIIFLVIVFTISCNSNKTNQLNPLINKLKYEKNGVSFSYYEGWKVTEEESKGIRHITINDRKDGLILLHFWQGNFSSDLSLYAKNIIGNYDKNLRMDKIPEMAVSVERKINEQNFVGQKYEFIKRISLTTEIPFVAEFYEVKGKTNNITVHLENAVSDWQESQSDFQLVVESLKFE